MFRRRQALSWPSPSFCCTPSCQAQTLFPPVAQGLRGRAMDRCALGPCRRPAQGGSPTGASLDHGRLHCAPRIQSSNRCSSETAHSNPPQPVGEADTTIQSQDGLVQQDNPAACSRQDSENSASRWPSVDTCRHLPRLLGEVCRAPRPADQGSVNDRGVRLLALP